MLTLRYCQECGSEIGFDYKTTTKSYLIDVEKQTFIRNDNNDAWEPNHPYLEFYCTEDMGHTLLDSDEFDTWKNEVSTIFFKSIMEKL